MWRRVSRAALSIRLAAVVDPGYQDDPGRVKVEEHAPLPDTQPEVANPALKPLHVSLPGGSKPLQSLDYTLLRDAVESVEIADRRWKELHCPHHRP